MSTQPNPAVKAMSPEELNALVGESLKSALAPAIELALEPLRKSTSDTLAGFEKLLKPSPASVTDEIRKGLGKHPYGRKARALAMAAIENGSMDLDAAKFAIKRSWAPTLAEPTIKWLEHEQQAMKADKGLTVGTPASAGDIVIPMYDEEWITLLRNNAVFRGMPGVRTKSMPRGAITQRKQTGTATASYQGELGPIVPSGLTVGKTNMSYKKLTAATVVSNDEIRFGGPDVDQMVQEDLLAVSGLREDRAFFLGNPPVDTGSPQGVRYQTLALNVSASAGATLANFQSDLTSLIRDVQKRNIPVTPQNSGFVMSVSTFWTIYALTTTTGDWVFKAGLEQARPTIMGFPVYLTTQFEVTNAWIGASAGMVMFLHGPSMVIWDSMQRTVEVFRGGAYKDETGTIQSGISNDETVVTCIAEHDFQQRYQEAAAIKTGYAT
jgi:HK97 family phage major capsid protein